MVVNPSPPPNAVRHSLPLCPECVTRNSAVADNLRDAFVEMMIDLLKHVPPHVFPCHIWSFCVKVCRQMCYNIKLVLRQRVYA